MPLRVLRFLGWALRHPLDFARAMFLPGWAHNATILLVMQHADMGKIEELARSEGMRTMYEDGLRKAMRGITTFEEVLRVTQIEEHLDALIDDTKTEVWVKT